MTIIKWEVLMHSALFSFLSALRLSYCRGIFSGDILEEVSYRDLFSFKIPGVAYAVIVPKDLVSLMLAVRLAEREGAAYCIVGGGSNILPPDMSYYGALILTKHLSRIEICGTKIKAECGSPLNMLILYSRDAGLAGLAPLYGIPAAVGGAVYMNAGAHAVSVSDAFEGALLYDPVRDEKHFFTRSDMAFSYRSSILQREKRLVLLYAVFSLRPATREAVRASLCASLEKRRTTQPLSLPSAGSVFRRPHEGVEVWRLVDACGLRGFSIGGAAVSEKHAGFIVNRGGASSRDVRALIALIRERVYAETGVLLTPEIEFLEAEGV